MRLLFCSALCLLLACSPDTPSFGADAGPDGGADVNLPDTNRDTTPPPPPPCEPEEILCEGGAAVQCGADGRTRTTLETCQQACSPGIGCTVCVANGRFCDGNRSMVCAADGRSSSFGRDCAEFGATCGSDGYCADECGQAEASNSYLGCEYWVPVLPNAGATSPGTTLQTPEQWRATFDFRVVVANAGQTAASVQFNQGGVSVNTITLEPGSAQDVVLPWSPAAQSQVSYADEPIRVISDRPITAAMFNPFEYGNAGEFSYTNDASLLFPAHTYQQNYMAPSYVARTGSSFVSIVATQDTEVSVRPTDNVRAGGPVPAMVAGTITMMTMSRGQHFVLQGNDLSGTRIQSSAPVAAFSGTQCANVPVDRTACDHLESQLPPIETWSNTYVSASIGENVNNNGNPVRIHSAVDGTMITITQPTQAPMMLTLNDGQFQELILQGPFVVQANNPVLVAQYLPGQTFSGAGRGDPAMMILPPVVQWRNDYPFVAPTSYNPGTRGQNFLLLLRSPGESISLDGAQISASWIPVGDYEYSIVPIDGGSHRLTAEEPFGVISYGLGSYTSYAYPAGLDLEVEYEPPPVLM